MTGPSWRRRSEMVGVGVGLPAVRSLLQIALWTWGWRAEATTVNSPASAVGGGEPHGVCPHRHPRAPGGRPRTDGVARAVA